MNVNFKFSIGDAVRIVKPGIMGVVTGSFVSDGNTNKAEVEWWRDGTKQSEWFLESKLVAAPS